MIQRLLNWWHAFERSLDRVQPRQARCAIISVVGFTLLLLGLLMTVLPGPAFVVIPAGLAVLALEFAWARSLLHHAKRYAEKLRRRPVQSGHSEPQVATQRTR